MNTFLTTDQQIVIRAVTELGGRKGVTAEIMKRYINVHYRYPMRRHTLEVVLRGLADAGAIEISPFRGWLFKTTKWREARA